MKSRNQLVEQFAREAAEQIHEWQMHPDGRTIPFFVENAMYRLLSAVAEVEDEKGSELLRQLQTTMVKKGKR